jgi:hypothetical protein
MQRPEAQRKTAMSKLISRRGGSRYIYDEDKHVEQVDEINAKMTNISLQTWPDFESAKWALEHSKLEWRETE